MDLLLPQVANIHDDRGNFFIGLQNDFASTVRDISNFSSQHFLFFLQIKPIRNPNINPLVRRT
jgi:hypothetical protein